MALSLRDSGDTQMVEGLLKFFDVTCEDPVKKRASCL